MTVEPIIFIDETDCIEADSLKNECVLSIERGAKIYIPNSRIDDVIEVLKKAKK